MNTARRQSNALSVGSTPLNKVITIILAAQKTSPAYVAQALDEVISYFWLMILSLTKTLPSNKIEI